MTNWIDLLFYGDYGAASRGPESVLLVLVLACVIGQLVAWVYMWTHSGLSYSQTFVASLVVLPVLVALMMLLMSGSLVVALGFMAVFAVVRFRNVLKDTRDTAFILWTLVEGMAVGTMQHSTAVVGAVCLGLIFLYLRTTAFGSRHHHDAVLTLILTGNQNGGVELLKSLLRGHCARVQLTTERKLAEDGLQLGYRLLLRDPSRSDELESVLKQTECVERVALFLREDESEA